MKLVYSEVSRNDIILGVDHSDPFITETIRTRSNMFEKLNWFPHKISSSSHEKPAIPGNTCFSQQDTAVFRTKYQVFRMKTPDSH